MTLSLGICMLKAFLATLFQLQLLKMIPGYPEPVGTYLISTLASQYKRGCHDGLVYVISALGIARIGEGVYLGLSNFYIG